MIENIKVLTELSVKFHKKIFSVCVKLAYQFLADKNKV